MDEKAAENNANFSDYNKAVYYEIPKKLVSKLALDLGSAHVVLVSGKDFSVETRGISESGLICNLSEEGCLFIKNVNRLPAPGFFSHDRRRHSYPQILITIPAKVSLESFSITFKAGLLSGDKLSVSYKKGFFDCRYGKAVVSGLKGEKSLFRSVLGFASFSGKFGSRTDADCYLGRLCINNSSLSEDSSLDCKVAFSQVEFDDQVSSFWGRQLAPEIRKSHYSVNSALGTVSILTEKGER